MLLSPATIGAIQQDPIRRIFKQSSLDLRFAENKSLVDAISGANLVSFTRASSGTYVGSDGLIKTATTNLLLWSEDASQWTNLQQSGSTITNDSVASPNGDYTADTLELSANSYRYTGYATAQTGAYAFSVWLRADSSVQVGIRANNSSGTESISASCNVSTVWQRFSVTKEFTSSPTILRCGIDGRTLAGGTGSAVTVYIWGAQLEQSSTVGEYVKTTSTINSAPRFDHDPTTGESLGLLVEESRTNLLLRSEEFDNAAWSRTTIGSFGTVSFSDATTSPDGKQTADLIVPTSGGSLGVAFMSQVITKPAVATTYTLSCFGKKQNFDVLRVFVRDTSTNNNRVEYAISLDDGSVVTAPTAVGTFTAVSSSVVSYPNGWYRARLVFTTSTETSITTRIYANDSIATVGDDVSGIYLWGAQLEAGSFPTSYIPTTTSAVTRAADVADISGSNFSSWFNEAAGSFYSSSSILGRNQTASTATFYANGIFKIRNDTVNNSFSRTHHYHVDASQRIMAGARDASGIQFLSENTLSISPGSVYSMASAYTNASVDAAICVNGRTPVNASSSTSITLTGLTTMLIGTGYFGAIAGGAPGGDSMYLNGTIRRLVYWGQRLPNGVLQSITQ